MQIRNVMTRNPQLINPDDTIQHAARLMAECDCGILPVSEGDHLVGMISDRDIAIRGIGNGKGPHSKVRDAMTREVKYCFEDEDAAHVAKNMADLQVRRLPVMNRDKRLVGIVSLSDLARKEPDMGKALAEIAQPGDQHNQAVTA
ncbi:MAG: CBS domain-containing protein [Stellaceae bacterium]